MKSRPWNRYLWGVVFTGGDKTEEPMLVGSHWHHSKIIEYEGEPARGLLFCNRKYAREWCSQTNTKWKSYNDGIVEKWKVRPVRVIETIAIMKGEAE